MENVEQQTTLRDDLLASFDSVEAGDVAPDAPQIETAAVETDAQKADRLRDEAGRFAKADDKTTAAPAAKTSAPQATKPAPVPSSEPTTPVVAEAHRKPRPSSWKKDYDPHWETLAPELQDYIIQREGQFASGVSTYKQEAEHARALNDSIAPFLPIMQQHGVQPTQLIPNLLAAHTRLATGSQQDKVMFGAKIINDYGIDPQALFQVLSGRVQYQQPQPPQQPQIDIDRVVEQKLTQREIQSEYNRFVSEAPEKYPHYETVKDTMAGLLQAGLAQDYPSAYEAALRHPRHNDIYEQAQQQRQQSEVAAQAAQRQAVASRARSQAVSVKSSTPSGTMTQAPANKSLRDDIASAFDAHSTGRV